MSNIKKTRLIVTDHAFDNTHHEQAVAKIAGAEFAEYQCQSEDETLNAVKKATVILNNFAPITRRVMQAMPTGAVIVRYGIGVDNVDLIAARELAIRVCNVPDYGIEEVADHAAAMTLFLARKLNHYHAGICNGEWKINKIVNEVRSLHETTVGLIGIGRIARAYAARMAAFGCHLIGFDPYISNEEARTANVQPMAYEKVIARANVLSLHVPLTSETRHLIDAETISRMPAGAIIINCSRGGLVDEIALSKALSDGHLSGAGLDVFEKEPLAADSPLRKSSQVILSPHAAFFSSTSVNKLQQLASEEALRGLRGEALRCSVI